MDILGEVRKLAEENPTEAKQVVDKAEQIVDSETGNRFNDQIGKGADLLEGQLGLPGDAQQGN